MQINLDIRAYAPSGWATRAALVGMFIGIAVVLIGVTISVEYSWVRVIDIQQQAGRDMWARIAIVDTPDRVRVLRTSDPLLHLQKGAYACVSKRRLISRRWQRHGVELPGYCRSVVRPGAAPRAPLPGLG